MGDLRPPTPADQVWEQMRLALDERRTRDAMALLDRLYAARAPWLPGVVQHLMDYWRVTRLDDK